MSITHNHQYNYLSALFEDVAITSLYYRHAGNSEQLTTSCAEINVAAFVENGLALGKHRVVLQLGLPVHRKVIGEQNGLSLSVSDVS